MKTNAESTANYHSQLTTIKVRFPSEESCGVDYASLIRERAKELGYVVEKGKDKGAGSANSYILHLVEEDLKAAGMIEEMIKGMSEVVKDDKR